MTRTKSFCVQWKNSNHVNKIKADILARLNFSNEKKIISNVCHVYKNYCIVLPPNVAVLQHSAPCKCLCKGSLCYPWAMDMSVLQNLELPLNVYLRQLPVLTLCIWCISSTAVCAALRRVSFDNTCATPGQMCYATACFGPRDVCLCGPCVCLFCSNLLFPCMWLFNSSLC